MGKLKLKSFIPVGVGLLTFATLVGSISGSLAWWAYSTRVSVSYQGTSVNTSQQLQIGLKLKKTDLDEDKATAITALGLIEDTSLATTGDYRYFFANAGGGLPAGVISEYLQLEGKYATEELTPITSNEYVTGNDLTLYQSLVCGHATNTDEAFPEKYVYLPFVFRILKLNAVAEESKYVANKEIYLTDVLAEAAIPGTSSTVTNALRVHFNDNTSAGKFILNISDHSYNKSMSEAEKAAAIAKMYTPVAGVLDLNSDGFYDSGAGKEIIYGDVGTIDESSTDTFNPGSTAPTKLSDVNGVYADIEDAAEKDAILSDLTNHSTFVARHPTNIICYNNYDGIQIKNAQYKTLEMIKPDETHGSLSNGTPVCVTSNDAKGIAELGVTIWLEGWDHTIIDNTLDPDYKFNLGLQFQIDLIN